MFGYVRPAPARLSEDEKERFHSVYCGLCHTLDRRCGLAARFLLNYDFTFLAILLAAGEDMQCANRRCFVHPCRGCAAASGKALEAAADRSVILAWWQIRDHIADHGFLTSLPYRLAALFLRRAYQRARAAVPAFDATVRERLRELDEREREHCASLDAAAEPFAALLAACAEAEPDAVRQRILHQIFYHLGRWIYLVDAADDFSADARSGGYNPLRYRYDIAGDELPEDVKHAIGETLDASIGRMADAYALLDAGVWAPILDSVFYDSLYGIGKAVLDGVYRKPSRMRNYKTMSEDTV